MKVMVDVDKTIESALFILNRVGSCDLHKLFKILYFADKEHITEYGRPITYDSYIAMKNGPVPSFLYDALKFVKGNNLFFRSPKDVKCFEIAGGYYVGATRDADVDFLSETDIECLHNSVQKYKDFSFDKLTAISHDDAWTKADTNEEMQYLDIASAGGAGVPMLQYIIANFENHSAFVCL